MWYYQYDLWLIVIRVYSNDIVFILNCRTKWVNDYLEFLIVIWSTSIRRAVQIDRLGVRRELRRGVSGAAARRTLACGCSGGGRAGHSARGKRGWNARAAECSATCGLAQCSRGGRFGWGRRAGAERPGDRAPNRPPERRGGVQQIARQMWLAWTRSAEQRQVEDSAIAAALREAHNEQQVRPEEVRLRDVFIVKLLNNETYELYHSADLAFVISIPLEFCFVEKFANRVEQVMATEWKPIFPLKDNTQTPARYTKVTIS